MVQLDFARRVCLPRGRTVPFHDHRALEVVYYVSGRGTTTLNGVCHTVGPHVFTINPAGVVHDQVNRTRVVSLCFGLTDSGLEPLAGAHRDQGGVLHRVCEGLLAETAEQAPAWQEVVEGLTLQLAGGVRRLAAQATDKPRREAIVDQALAIIEREEGRVSVAALSDQLFVSRDYLRHLFREFAGRPPMRLIIEKRLAEARRLLQGTDCTVAEAARRAGFESPYYFSRLFKQVIGQTPSAWRQSQAR